MTAAIAKKTKTEEAAKAVAAVVEIEPALVAVNLDGQAFRMVQVRLPDAIDIDAAGDIFVLGGTRVGTFPSSWFVNGFQKQYKAAEDVVVAKIAGNGSRIIWATYIGGSSIDYAHAVAVDPLGNPVVTGYTLSPDFPFTAGAYDTTSAGYDAYAVKFDAAGALLWGTYLGGRSTEFGQAIREHYAERRRGARAGEGQQSDSGQKWPDDFIADWTVLNTHVKQFTPEALSKDVAPLIRELNAKLAAMLAPVAKTDASKGTTGPGAAKGESSVPRRQAA
jgi:hypothetical protein